MLTLNLSGFQPGDNLNISVSQGALTAGPVNVPAWGGAVPSGDITITVDRGHMQVAPESVRLGVDLSGSNFDTPAPGPGEYYDARLHELIFLWDLNDSGTWTKPVNMIEAWRAKGTAKGPFVMHMYSNPGTYSPSVLVIEPSSGKTATAVLSGADAITVLNPDDVYPGAATICINPVGDDDWTGAPAGADRINVDYFSDTHSAWLARLNGAAKRWLFKRGAEFTTNLKLVSNTTRGVYFGAYGPDPAKPVIGWDGVPEPDVRDTSCFYVGAYGQDGNPLTAADIRFVGLQGRNSYDPVTTRSDYNQYDNSALFLWGLGDSNYMIHDCDFSGFQASTLNMAGSDPNKEVAIHIDDCSVNNFGGQYVIFGGKSTHARSGVALTGCRVAQNVDAVGSDGNSQGSSRAIMRSESPRRYHARGNDLYHTDQNQHCLAPFKTPRDYGGIVNIHSCVMEGANGAVVLYANPRGGQSIDTGNSICLNAVIDGVIYFSNHTSMQPFMTHATGVTIRNCLVVQPSVSRVYGNGNQVGFLHIRRMGTFDPLLVGDVPIRVYNNTYVYEKTDAQTSGGNFRDVEILFYSSDPVPVVQEFTNVLEENNVLHKPNFGPIGTQVTTFAPLTSAVLFTHRNKGARNTDPGFGYEKNSSTVILNGASKTYAYGSGAYGFDPVVYPSMQISQATFAGSTGKEQVWANNTTYQSAKGHFTVVYGPTEITVTNTSGVDWYRNTNKTFDVQFDMGTTAPIAPDSVPPAGSWKDYKPGPGSTALGAALSGNVSYMDILMQERPEPPSMGAWEAD